MAMALTPLVASAASPSNINAKSDDRFLILSDIHLSDSDVADYYTADTGPALWSRTQSEFRELIRTTKPTFLLILGDLPGHVNPALTPQQNQQRAKSNIQTVVTGLSRIFRETAKPAFYVFGNNDSFRGDLYSFYDNDATPHTLFGLDDAENWPTANASQPCSAIASGEVACTLDMTHAERLAYYSVKPLGKARRLRLIILNSSIFATRYRCVDGGSQTAEIATEIAWFEQQLAEAKSANDAALIAMHIPPGIYRTSTLTDEIKPWVHTAELEPQRQFLQLVTRYHSTIRGVLTGHVHMDEFRRLRSSDGTMQAIDIGTPGITPILGGNPAMKAISYDPTTFDLLDAVTYYNTPKASQNHDWGHYSFRESFGCNKKTLFACINAISTTSSKFQRQYKKNFPSRSSKFRPLHGWPVLFDTIDVTESP